jgi:hypothetical protein
MQRRESIGNHAKSEEFLPSNEVLKDYYFCVDGVEGGQS